MTEKMREFTRTITTEKTLRLPFEGRLDLTYRCNFNCRHCWLRLPVASDRKIDELSFDDIRKLVEDAREMGCRKWVLSGGEPLLRSDFLEIFEYVTTRAGAYTINTNGSLITPRIAKSFVKKGTKMVSLYGGTAEIQDHITRSPGSFERTMRGFSYLKEAGAGFIVQIVPMRDNYHQVDAMKRLAESFDRPFRFGAGWLNLSSDRDPIRNEGIKDQRLSVGQAMEIDTSWMSGDRRVEKSSDDRLFADCVRNRRVFHVDPYGSMSFCGYIKEPSLRFDLRSGTFRECWDDFLPSVCDLVRGGNEYAENCRFCENRTDCRWCPVFGFLECGRYSARVACLCDMAREKASLKKKWNEAHNRYFQCGEITIHVESELPITENTFDSKFDDFQVDEPGEDPIRISHYFTMPNLKESDWGQPVRKKTPWDVYRKGDSWIYVGRGSRSDEKNINYVAIFDMWHNHGQIYHSDRVRTMYENGGLMSLTMFPTDQIVLSPALANREGCIFHSGGVIMRGKGLLFVGHSEAGKSTTMMMLKDKAELLCDDRNIVRKRADGFKLYGTWSHGDVPIISAASAPLRAIMFLEQATENRLIPMEDPVQIVPRLLECLIKGVDSREWWEKMLPLVGQISRQVPCYRLRFDKSGEMARVIEDEILK